VFEEVPPERCRLRWIARRNLRQGLGSARFSRKYEGGVGALARIYAIAAYRVGLGLSLAVVTLGLVPSQRLRLIENLASGVGLALGSFGVDLDEYGR
jgi:hypothetical protein